MTYKEFESEMQRRIQSMIGSRVTVTPQISLKNNQTFQHGLLFRETPKNPGISISPIVYLDDFYCDYLDGTSLEEIEEKLLKAYGIALESSAISLEYSTCFDRSKGNIVYRLINRDMNKEMLQNMPHVPYLDLAIVFYCILKFTDDLMACFPIMNEYLEQWNLQVEDLQKYTQQNTPRELPYSFQTVQTVLSESGEYAPSLFPENPATQLWVLTNQFRQHGAACILYDHVLAEIGKTLGEDYYVIPSSIHEVLIIRSSQTEDVFELSNVIKEVNATALLKADILSSHPYFYNCTTNTLTSVGLTDEGM